MIVSHKCIAESDAFASEKLAPNRCVVNNHMFVMYHMP
jgi:hypothetical protein